MANKKSKSNKRRTQIKDLPKVNKNLNRKDMQKVKGGAGNQPLTGSIPTQLGS